jgi:hypothetical protein
MLSKPYTLTLTLSLKGEGINGWTLINRDNGPALLAASLVTNELLDSL